VKLKMTDTEIFYKNLLFADDISRVILNLSLITDMPAAGNSCE
jgi:hypothetical protein